MGFIWSINFCTAVLTLDKVWYKALLITLNLSPHLTPLLNSVLEYMAVRILTLACFYSYIKVAQVILSDVLLHYIVSLRFYPLPNYFNNPVLPCFKPNFVSSFVCYTFNYHCFCSLLNFLGVPVLCFITKPSNPLIL